MSHQFPPGGPGGPGGSHLPPPPPQQPYSYPSPYAQPQVWGQVPQGPPPPPPGKQGGGGLKGAVIGVVVLAVLAVFGLGGLAVFKAVGSDSLPSAAGGDKQAQELLSQQDIKSLLQGRTDALKNGDEDAYLSVFAGKAKTTQEKLYRNLRKVPFTQAEFSVLSQEGSGKDEFGDGVSVAVDVAFVHRIKNVDVRPIAEWYRWVVKRESADAEPEITSVGPAPTMYGSGTFVYYPAPWDLYDDMYVKSGAHSIVIADKKNASNAARYAPYMEQAADYDLGLWKQLDQPQTDTPKGFMLVLEPDRKKYAKLWNSGGEDVGWDAGQAVPMPAFDESSSADSTDGLQWGGSRIKMDTSTSRFTSASYWQMGVTDISRHEMAHALVEPLDHGDYTFGGAGGAKTWIVEGFANYVAYRGNSTLSSARIGSTVSGEEFDGALPKDDFGDQSPRSISMNYTLSYLAIRYIAEKGGEKAAFDFVVDNYEKPKQLDTSLQSAVGMDTTQFQSSWAAYVRSVS